MLELTGGYGAVVTKSQSLHPKTPMKPELWPLHFRTYGLVYQEGFGNGPLGRELLQVESSNPLLVRFFCFGSLSATALL